MLPDYSGYSRLGETLESTADDLYPDVEALHHVEITDRVIKLLAEREIIKRDSLCLDIGAGCGIGRTALQTASIFVTSIDIAPQIKEALLGDQSFMEFRDSEFNFIWARHVIEHSIMPYHTLREYARVLATGGYAYIEVPAPDTGACHESNANHYSVLGLRAWIALMKRVFRIADIWEYSFTIPQSDGSKIADIYWGFLVQKEKTS